MIRPLLVPFALLSACRLPRWLALHGQAMVRRLTIWRPLVGSFQNGKSIVALMVLRSAADPALQCSAREIQAQEGISGLPVNPWGGPPTSGNSTPLRENIPESPTDGFPDFTQLPTPDSLPQTRRARAGTVPSRFPAGAGVNSMLNIPALAAKTSRPSPSHTPFKSPSPGIEQAEGSASTLLSRLRAGSMPQRSPGAMYDASRVTERISKLL